MSEAVKAFTVGTVERRVLSDGIMAYEPDSLYTGLPSEQTAPVVSPLEPAPLSHCRNIGPC